MLPLIKAVLSGDVCRVCDLLELKAENIDLDGTDAEGRSALMFAVENGNSDIVDALLEAGASCTTVDTVGFTPLHMTAAAPVPGIVRALVDAGGSVSSKNMWGVSPLMSVAHCGHPCVLWELLQCGAGIHETDSLGQTSLMIASAWGQAECVDMLITAGADVAIQSVTGLTALHGAAQSGHPRIIRALIEAGADAESDSTMSPVGTPLHYAAGSGNASAVRELMRWGARVSTADAKGVTPLHAAAYSGQFRALLGMFDEFPDAQRRSRRIRAEKLKTEEPGGEPRCSDYSLNLRLRALPLQPRLTSDVCVALSSRDTAGQTALHYAVIGLQVRAVKVLLDGGAVETEKDTAGYTPSGAMSHMNVVNNGILPSTTRPDVCQVLARLLARGPAMRARSWEWPKVRASKRNKKQEPGMILVNVYRQGACKKDSCQKTMSVMKSFSR